MNLFKVYAALGIFLAVCTYNAEGGIILLLILKIIALKGALFFGLPLALGSFLLGQGMGFFGGTLFGGYGVLHAAHKYLSSAKHHVAHHVVPKPVHVYHGPPKFNHGWGWSTPPAHNIQFYKYTRKPTIWNKISTIPGTLINRFKKQPVEKRPYGWASPPSPGWTQSATTLVHGQNPLNTYYETDHSPKHHHHEHSISLPTDWDSIIKQAELEAEQKANAGSYGIQDEHSHNSGYNSYSTSSSNSEHNLDGGYGSSSSFNSGNYESPSNGHSISNYETPSYSSKYEASSGGYGDSKYESSPLEGYSSSKYETPLEGYSSSKYQSFDDDQGLESSDFYKKIPAPNSVLEKFLENKLQEEIRTQKSESKKRDAAQLIQMLRQVYMQELTTSLDPSSSPSGKDPTARSLSVGNIPEFKPFPSVPNSTTAKPTTTTSSTTTPALVVPSKTLNSNPLFGDTGEAKFVPMQTSFTLRRRSGTESVNVNLGQSWSPEPSAALTAPALRNRRQTLPVPTDLSSAQALMTFADDVKKFFLLVSLLDQDRCLQKLVCDVHTKGADANLTPYESNIVITFKVMNAILPVNVEDSTTNYRKAAKIGELSKNVAVCGKAYPTCNFTTEQIIDLGNQAAAESSTQAQAGPPSPDMMAEATDEKEQIIAQVPNAPSSPSPITAMPRV